MRATSTNRAIWLLNYHQTVARTFSSQGRSNVQLDYSFAGHAGDLGISYLIRPKELPARMSFTLWCVAFQFFIMGLTGVAVIHTHLGNAPARRMHLRDIGLVSAAAGFVRLGYMGWGCSSGRKPNSDSGLKRAKRERSEIK